MSNFDPLLVHLFENILDLKEPPRYLNRRLGQFGTKQVEALKKNSFLITAPNAECIPCPEEECEHCTVFAFSGEEDLFSICSEREDMARIPIQIEDVEQSQLNFTSIAEQLSDSLGKLPLRRESSEKFDVCYLNGHTLSILAGVPVELCVDDKKAPLAELMTWTGTHYCFRVDLIRKLVPSLKGAAESTKEKRTRYLSRFMELKKQNSAVSVRQQLMAKENGESLSNVRRILADALNDPEVKDILGLPKMARLTLKSI